MPNELSGKKSDIGNDIELSLPLKTLGQILYSL